MKDHLYFSWLRVVGFAITRKVQLAPDAKAANIAAYIADT